ncbi:hypothetical protein V9T40_001871 [Parthenolecanium corni]|uniref:C2H2-type domain-containing protein n=1 Tax=Parthenolecanium corni TaxID=536013 RepID=A0AAN9TJT8_9HEMI
MLQRKTAIVDQFIMANFEDERITISETVIKIEPTDDGVPLTIDKTGDFVTVLVPENPQPSSQFVSADVKPVVCAKCGSVIDKVTFQPNAGGLILCQKCQTPSTSTGGSTASQAKKVLLNAISNGETTLPFRCHYCSKMFDTKELFYNHIRIHAVKKCNPYLCGMCGKNFKELLQFKKHICARNVLKCYKCNKQFESIFRLENHYYIHTKYKCEQCGRCLSSKTVLEEHKRVHTNEYPFKCEICSRQFRQKSKYKGHVISCKANQTPLVSKKNGQENIDL